ncbi:MAG: hypothetical protein CM15mP109_10570 [Candidatus Dadabacteria bacterium]|nr:MAG: hypothetical protein CM15mP109_10570 [Candidatus Dadabacteria bacterium]
MIEFLKTFVPIVGSKGAIEALDDALAISNLLEAIFKSLLFSRASEINFSNSHH